MTRLFLRTGGARVKANPHAKPVPPVKLDDSNSVVDPLQPDCRKATVLNGRQVVAAGVIGETEKAEATAKAIAAAAAAKAKAESET